MQKLSTQQAQKLVLHSQGLPPARASGTALSATHRAIERINYVQIDTLSVVQRAHHHTLWNRNPRYHPQHLDQLLADKAIFEYWSHAAAYLPMRDYRFSLPRKHAIKTGEQNHWYARDKKLMRSLLDKIRAEGPLMVKDFDGGGEKTGQWHSKPAKRALQYLFMQGDLMVPYRHHFHKVYELTQRVIPSAINQNRPSKTEYHDYLIKHFLKANGLGAENEMVYLLKNMRGVLKTRLCELLERNELVQLKVGQNAYYALSDSLHLLDKPLNRRQLKILSPFDNLLIQRKRMQELFAYDYQIECYIPAEKRQHGYFCLPILWNGELLARLDCKAHRALNTVQIHSLYLDQTPKNLEGFCAALLQELQQFAHFNECTKINCDNLNQQKTNPTVRAALASLNACLD